MHAQLPEMGEALRENPGRSGPKAGTKLRGGYVRVHTGNGKGKTTAALGLGLSAISQGLKVFMVQFLKRPQSSGEHFAAMAVSPLFEMRPMGTGGFILKRQCKAEERAAGQQALEEARHAMFSGDYAMIILDEANVAVDKKIIDLQQLLDLIASKPETVDLVITGRNARSEVMQSADVVVEMKKIKHPFDRGLRARKGIDY